MTTRRRVSTRKGLNSTSGTQLAALPTLCHWSIFGQSSCLICARSRQQTFPVCCLVIITWGVVRDSVRCFTSSTNPELVVGNEKMAEVSGGGRSLLPSGYEYEFISTVLDDYHCLICHLPLREPVQTRCGHRFCKNCLDEAIRRYE